jgi:TPR repeat protein
LKQTEKNKTKQSALPSLTATSSSSRSTSSNSESSRSTSSSSSSQQSLTNENTATQSATSSTTPYQNPLSTYNSTPNNQNTTVAIAGTVINSLGNLMAENIEARRAEQLRKEAQNQRDYEKKFYENVEKEKLANWRLERNQKSAEALFEQAKNSFNNFSNKTIQSKVNLLITNNLICSYYSFYEKDLEKSFFPNLNKVFPNYEAWLQEAIEAKNGDAIVLQHGTIKSQKDIEALKLSALAGSNDAMIILGNYYNEKKDMMAKFGNEKRMIGNDNKLALYYYTTAANNGCPAGNYYLGMISVQYLE